MDISNKEDYSLKDYLRFIIPSIMGIIILMFPFKYEGDTTIFVALLAKKLTGYLENVLPLIILVLISITTIFTITYKLFKPNFIEKSEFLKGIFNPSLAWTIVRIIGMLISILVYFQIGPEWIWSDSTGGLILNELILGLFAIFLFGGFLLPFLTDFGLLEFVGVLLTPVMRPLFQLPGRSSIDCIASWVGDGTIGVTLTNSQYEQGYYTAKESAIIATTFSAVSITFSLLVLDQVNLTHLFGPYYLTVTLAGIVAAIIMPKLPPLSNKPDKYYDGNKMDLGEAIPEGYTNFQWGLKLAVEKAKQSGNVVDFIKNGMEKVLDMWLGVLPVIMAFGTIALIIAEATPIFNYLGMPFVPIFKLFNVPYAVEASQTIMVGFADMFIPSVMAATIESDMTRFIIAALSVTQLVYLSEAGAVILGTKIPISPLDLFIIFIERTLITLPIIIIMAKIIF